jgi:hypothetical protein
VISLKRQFAEGEGDTGGANGRRKGASSQGAGTTTILAHVTIGNHIDVGDHVVTNVQKRLLRLRDALK